MNVRKLKELELTDLDREAKVFFRNKYNSKSRVVDWTGIADRHELREMSYYHCAARILEFLDEISNKEKQAIEYAKEMNGVGSIEALLNRTVFLVDQGLEYCEKARIETIVCTDKRTSLKLKTISGRHESRNIEELGKTIFFTEDKALAALKVDEDGNPINTYLTEFIKRFPEHKGKEREILDEACCSQIFGLQGCRYYIEERTPADCQACWNRPYKEDKTK